MNNKLVTPSTIENHPEWVAARVRPHCTTDTGDLLQWLIVTGRADSTPYTVAELARQYDHWQGK